MSNHTRQRVLEFLATDRATGMPIDDDTELLHSGILDSMKVVELIGFIEESFSIRLQESDLVEENLRSVASIVSFVERRCARRAGA